MSGTNYKVTTGTGTAFATIPGDGCLYLDMLRPNRSWFGLDTLTPRDARALAQLLTETADRVEALQ